MFIPRADVSDSCSASEDACSPNAAPSDSDASSGFDPSLMNKPGPHRYIGIGMVAGLILIIFLAWLYRGRWPRKMFQQYCSCCCSRSKQQSKPIDDETSSTPVRSPERDKSGSEQRLVEEVSAGMVVFTKVPNALRAKERHPMEWEMDHINGIRVETRTPPRHHARNGSRQS